MIRDFRVIRSINNEDASHCVDIFQRADGTFGFDEFRRDGEDARGWFPIGVYSSIIFCDPVEAQRLACETIQWLSKVFAPD